MLEVVEADEELALRLVGILVDRVGGVLEPHELEDGAPQVGLPSVVLRLQRLRQVRVELEHVREVDEERGRLRVAHHLGLLAVRHARPLLVHSDVRFEHVAILDRLLSVAAQELQEPRLDGLGRRVRQQLHLRRAVVGQWGGAATPALGPRAGAAAASGQHLCQVIAIIRILHTLVPAKMAG